MDEIAVVAASDGAAEAKGGTKPLGFLASVPAGSKSRKGAKTVTSPGRSRTRPRRRRRCWRRRRPPPPRGVSWSCARAGACPATKTTNPPLTATKRAKRRGEGEAPQGGDRPGRPAQVLPAEAVSRPLRQEGKRQEGRLLLGRSCQGSRSPPVRPPRGRGRQIGPPGVPEGVPTDSVGASADPAVVRRANAELGLSERNNGGGAGSRACVF